MSDDTPEGHRRWRFVISCCTAVFGLHVLWACGYGSPLGVPGFARTPDVIAIQHDLRTAADAAVDVRLRQLKRSLVAVRIQQCEAQSKRFFTTQLDELSDEYYQLEKERPPIPQCDELK